MAAEGGAAAGAADGGGQADRLLDDYLQLCYGWVATSASTAGARPAAPALSPEEEEFAEADELLRQRASEDSGFQQQIQARLSGEAPLTEFRAGDLVLRVLAARRGNEGAPQLSAHVCLADGTDSYGRWGPGWPRALHFDTRQSYRHSGVLWPCSLRLAAALLTEDRLAEPLLRPGAKTIELGAGVGLLGAVLALMGAASVLLTDHPECGDFPLAGARADLPPDRAASVAHHSLDWAEPLPETVAKLCPWDTVICSDLLYFGGAHAPLLSTLRRLCGDGDAGSGGVPAAARGSRVLFAYEARDRGGEAAFLAEASKHFLLEELVPADSRIADDDWHLYCFRAREP